MEMELPRQYGNRVKVSNWFERVLSLPHDVAYPTYESHHQTFGVNNEPYVPKTTTQEANETGAKATAIRRRPIVKKEINVVTYPMNDFRFENIEEEVLKSIRPQKINIISTYQRYFTAPIQKASSGKVKVPPVRYDEPPDRLLNRKPKNDFEMLPWSENKFMDDHFIHPTEGKKKVNFLRQLRNASHPFI